MDKAEEILIGFEHAKGDRQSWEGSWEDILLNCNPRKRGIQEKQSAGTKFPSNIYDSTATRANRIMAAGLSGYMTNASQRWFELQTRDSDLMDSINVRRYFYHVQNLIFSALANSNFYQQMDELYLDLGTVGTGALQSEEDPKNDVRFYARHIREIYAIENEREEVDVIYRKFEFTAYQAMRFFGRENLGDAVKAAIDQKKYTTPFNFLQYIAPRHERDVELEDAMNMPFQSCWLSLDDKKILKEGGFQEFPINVCRFYKNSTETYGYSPAFECFPDILMMNQVKRVGIEGMELAIYPPYLVHNDGMLSTLDLRAGAINYQRQSLTQGRAVEQMAIRNDFNVYKEMSAETRQNIESAFFVDLFLMISRSEGMTATEVMQRAQEKMLMLGPALGRLQSELLNPIIQRVYSILARRGKLPPLPEELKDKEYDVVYVSPLAKAQRALQANDIQSFLAIIFEMAKVAPDVMDIVNIDDAVEEIAKAKNVNAIVMNDPKKVAQIRQQKQQALAQKNRIEMFLAASQAANQTAGASEGFANARATQNLN